MNKRGFLKAVLGVAAGGGVVFTFAGDDRPYYGRFSKKVRYTDIGIDHMGEAGDYTSYCHVGTGSEPPIVGLETLDDIMYQSVPIEWDDP